MIARSILLLLIKPTGEDLSTLPSCNAGIAKDAHQPDLCVTLCTETCSSGAIVGL